MGWSNYIPLGTPAAGFNGDLTTICRNSEACNVYVRGYDNALWQIGYYEGHWHGWIRHEDNFRLDSSPVAGSLNSDNEHVFVIHDNQLYQKWWTA